MMTVQKRETFGQPVPAEKLGAMTRSIVSRIRNGQPAALAGFVWYRSEGLAVERVDARIERAA